MALILRSYCKDYEVHGIVQRTSVFNTDRINYLYRDLQYPEARMFLHYGGKHDFQGGPETLRGESV